MILEAFSSKLKNAYKRNTGRAEAVLHEWLSETLSAEEAANDIVVQVIQAEITQVTMGDEVWFVGQSKTGAELLNALYRYCRSFDNWQFTRWLHNVKASDFPTVQ